MDQVEKVRRMEQKNNGPSRDGDEEVKKHNEPSRDW